MDTQNQTCDACAFYVRHFGKTVDNGFVRMGHGHCTHPKQSMKITRAYKDTCAYWQALSQEQADSLPALRFRLERLIKRLDELQILLQEVIESP